MGSGSPVAAAAQPQRQDKSLIAPDIKLAPGQTAVIRNCPNTSLNGQRVVCEEYNAGLGEWLVKGDKFPLAIGMSLGAEFLAQFLEPIAGSIGGGTCPSGHTLRLRAVPACMDRARCDVCGGDIPKGRKLWECRACEFEKCSQCASVKASKPCFLSSEPLPPIPTLLRTSNSSTKPVRGKTQDSVISTKEAACQRTKEDPAVRRWREITDEGLIVSPLLTSQVRSSSIWPTGTRKRDKITYRKPSLHDVMR